MRKKIIITALALLFIPVVLFSQEEQPEIPAHEYHPVRGNFGIGLDAAPFLSYLGNMANGTTNNALNLGDNTLYFRYFISDNAALRFNMMVNLGRNSTTFYLPDDNATFNDPLSNLQVEDRRITVNNNLMLRAGYQQFIGQNRLRGFFGGDLGYGYQKGFFLYEYGNTMNQANPAPTTVINWSNGAAGNLSVRPLETVNSVVNTIFLGGFTGAEYYIMPRFAIGLEMGVQYGLGMPGNRYQVVETIPGGGSPGIKSSTEITTLTGKGTRSRLINSTMPYTYGNLYLFFHF